MMRDLGKQNVLGIMVDAVDYEAAVERIVQAGIARRPYAVTALAVHGVCEGVRDPQQRQRLNSFDMIVADGQPVRWGMRLLHGVSLQDRVYGPELMMRTCRIAAERDLSVYLYGSTPEVVHDLAARLKKAIPRLQIAGAEPSRFRVLTPFEKQDVVGRIRDSGASIVFVGLGCPRQEVWAYEYREVLGIPVIAVGAAFDFHAGRLRQAPPIMQRWGLEWLFRLLQEPRRLWRRYLRLNPLYAGLLLLQALRIKRFNAAVEDVVITEISFG